MFHLLLCHRQGNVSFTELDCLDVTALFALCQSQIFRNVAHLGCHGVEDCHDQEYLLCQHSSTHKYLESEMFACTHTYTEYITATTKPHIVYVCLILINNFNAGYLIENRKIDGNNQYFSLFFRSFNSEILSNGLVMESFPVTDDIPIRLSNLCLCTTCSR